jgi:hypothetical protein
VASTVSIKDSGAPFTEIYSALTILLGAASFVVLRMAIFVAPMENAKDQRIAFELSSLDDASFVLPGDG